MSRPGSVRPQPTPRSRRVPLREARSLERGTFVRSRRSYRPGRAPVGGHAHEDSNAGIPPRRRRAGPVATGYQSGSRSAASSIMRIVVVLVFVAMAVRLGAPPGSVRGSLRRDRRATGDDHGVGAGVARRDLSTATAPCWRCLCPAPRSWPTRSSSRTRPQRPPALAPVLGVPEAQAAGRAHRAPGFVYLAHKVGTLEGAEARDDATGGISFQPDSTRDRPGRPSRQLGARNLGVRPGAGHVGSRVPVQQGARRAQRHARPSNSHPVGCRCRPAPRTFQCRGRAPGWS